MALSLPRLMLVTDRRTAAFPLPELCRRAVAGGVDTVQVRERDLDEVSLLREVAAIQAAVDEGVCIVVNGSIKVAEELGTGVHLRESQIDRVGQARATGIALIGVSVHSVGTASSGYGADYLVAGHVFPTGSKPGLGPIGLRGLKQITASTPKPVLAIGGMTPDRVRCAVEAGARGIAVLSAINSAHDPYSAARAYVTSLENSMPETELITLTINGKPAEIPAGSTILDYLTSRGHHERMVVVEVNGTIYRREAFSGLVLSSGDHVEIVHFVGGG